MATLGYTLLKARLPRTVYQLGAKFERFMDVNDFPLLLLYGRTQERVQFFREL
jgi:hypothetical protein